jgi:putative oxidoreductase
MNNILSGTFNQATLKQMLATDAGLAALVLRVPVGIIFAAHGAQKLFGWFGGYGLTGTAGWLESIGLAPGLLMALLAGGAEFFGGLALILGLLTRPAAFALSIAMLVALVGALTLLPQLLISFKGLGPESHPTNQA